MRANGVGGLVMVNGVEEGGVRGGGDGGVREKMR